MTDAIKNSDARKYVSDRKPFTNTNKTMWGERYDDMYIAYSYGEHYPMYVYDYNAEQWFGNSQKSSRTTQRHKTQAMPDGDIRFANTDTLRAMILAGGYVSHCAKRINDQQEVSQ